MITVTRSLPVSATDAEISAALADAISEFTLAGGKTSKRWELVEYNAAGYLITVSDSPAPWDA